MGRIVGPVRAAILVTLATTGAAAAANLVANGDFANIGNVWINNTGLGADDWQSAKATAIPDWTNVSGFANEAWITSPNSYGGITESPANGSKFFADLTGQGDAKPYGGIKQTIATIAGASYILKFDLGASTAYNGSGLNAAALTASATGTSQLASKLFTLTPTNNNTWVSETLSFKADSSSTTIEFLGDSSYTSHYVGLDNVSVTLVTAPSIASLQPNSVDAGSAAFTLTVSGSNFSSGDTVDWNGVALPTTFVSASKLTAKVSAAEVAQSGSAAVTVVTTAADDGASEPLLFTIPVTSIVIASQTIKTISGGYSITLTLLNSGVKAATNISLTGANLASSETSSLLPVDIATIAAGGTKTVTLSFPAAAGKAGEEEYLLLYGSYAGGDISLSSLETLP